MYMYIYIYIIYIYIYDYMTYTLFYIWCVYIYIYIYIYMIVYVYTCIHVYIHIHIYIIYLSWTHWSPTRFCQIRRMNGGSVDRPVITTAAVRPSEVCPMATPTRCHMDWFPRCTGHPRINHQLPIGDGFSIGLNLHHQNAWTFCDNVLRQKQRKCSHSLGMSGSRTKFPGIPSGYLT